MLFAVEIKGRYQPRKTNMLNILLEAKSETEAIRKAQDIFLEKFPTDFVEEHYCLKITCNAIKNNPSARNPIEVIPDEPKTN